MLYYLSALPGSEIPDSPEFKAAFVIATAAYIGIMTVLVILFRRALKKLPKDKKSGSDSQEAHDIRNKQRKRRRPGSETGTDL